MDQKTIMKNYQEEYANIIAKMVKVLVRAQRKIDDKKYRDALEALKKI